MKASIKRQNRHLALGAVCLAGFGVACQGAEQPAAAPERVTTELSGSPTPPPPLGVQGLVRDMELHLQDFSQMAEAHPDDARELVLRVQYLFLEPLVRFYGPEADVPAGRDVAHRIEELEELILSLRRTLETSGIPNPDRIGEITEAIEAKLRSVLSAAEAAGIRPPIEEGRSG